MKRSRRHETPISTGRRSVLLSPGVGLDEDVSQLAGEGAGDAEHVDPVRSRRRGSERLSPSVQAIAVSVVDVDQADMNPDGGVTALDLAGLVTYRGGSPIALTIGRITAGVDSCAREGIDQEEATGVNQPVSTRRKDAGPGAPVDPHQIQLLLGLLVILDAANLVRVCTAGILVAGRTAAVSRGHDGAECRADLLRWTAIRPFVIARFLREAKFRIPLDDHLHRLHPGARSQRPWPRCRSGW
jgi:hypothetical protein